MTGTYVHVSFPKMDGKFTMCCKKEIILIQLLCQYNSININIYVTNVINIFHTFKERVKYIYIKHKIKRGTD